MFQFIKQRMKGAQNISQITKAMELVAATKMRRSQEIALRSRPYAYSALNLLRTLAALEENENTPPLLRKRSFDISNASVRSSLRSGTRTGRTAMMLVTSDKGLAGSFNSAVLRRFDKFIRDAGGSAMTFDFIAVGKKAQAHLEKQKFPVLQSFIRAGDFTTPEQVRPIAALLESQYVAELIDRAVVFSTHFRTALSQEVIEREILPISTEALTRLINELVPETGKYSELRMETRVASSEWRVAEPLIEPSAEQVLGSIASHLLHMQLYHLFMEANASEHAARRMAMKNASENAGELVQTLTLTYNKLRQAAITKEITEIVAGAEALRAN